SKKLHLAQQSHSQVPRTINSKLISVRPENPASATTTSIPTRRTAMERDIQSLLSLPQQERHADHHSNPFAVPDGMDGWVRDNLGSRSPSPPSQSRMENRATWCMPPQPEYESFFDDAYESIMLARGSNTSNHWKEEETTEPEPAIATAPFPEGTIVPPRSETILPSTSSEIEPMTRAEIQYNIQNRPIDVCIQPDCPILPRRHSQGHYLHNNRPPKNHLATFLTSNPPPNVWQAIHNGCLGVGTQHEANLISRYLEYYVTSSRDPTNPQVAPNTRNISVVPDTNFIWGDEIHNLPVATHRPHIRLPFQAVPLRIRFNARPNLDPMDWRDESEILEQEKLAEAREHDARRDRLRQRLMKLE
ncbi:MAG: hypothetical protein Q9226_009282, partial [Calogaya cf. arnoldii]